jgi:hypothetical protein
LSKYKVRAGPTIDCSFDLLRSRTDSKIALNNSATDSIAKRKNYDISILKRSSFANRDENP